MITLQYRLIGDVNNPVFTKTFDSRTDLNDWLVDQPVVVVSIESGGVEVYKRIFGGAK